MKEIIYKVPEGKLLRIDIDIEPDTTESNDGIIKDINDSIIKDIKISGDFFIYPEESIELIESSLKNIKVSEIKQTLARTITSSGMRIIGFTPEDVETAITSNT